MNRFFSFNKNGITRGDFIEADGNIDLSNCSADLCIKSVSNLSEAKEGDLSFFTTTLVSGNKYLEAVKNTKATYCLIKKQHSYLLSNNTKAIITADPYITFTRLCKKFILERDCNNESIIDSSIISKYAVIGNGVKIGKNVVIEDFVKIGNGVEIGDNTIIKSGVKVGKNCIIGKNCIVRENCVIQYSEIGNDCVFHSNCSVGQDGFGFAFDGRTGYNEKINHFGYVKIGNRVEIGANTCIDRGVFEATIIEDDVKLDNLVQIAHGVKVGKGTMMAGQTGIAGSATIGKYCMLGGKSGVAGHTKLGDQCILYGATNLSKGFPDKTRLIGTPGEPYNVWVKNYALLQNLLNKAKNNKLSTAKIGIKYYINKIIKKKK